MIQDQLSDSMRIVRERSDRIARYYDIHRSEIFAVAKSLRKIDDKVVRAEVADDCVDLSVSGDRHVLNAVFGAFRRLGYEPDERPATPEPTFSTYFRHPNHGCKLWLNFSSSTCRRVKIGTKTKEVDIYETVCE